MASSSALIDNIVTVLCLLAFHITGPSNNFIMYLCEFFLSMILLLNNILLEHISNKKFTVAICNICNSLVFEIKSKKLNLQPYGIICLAVD